ncbi:peptidase [Chitinimonas sp.]|uniref:peptidase n=1 Tax=Chitinimonas sp. TaxID=1934313 RepID=UPI0035B08592
MNAKPLHIFKAGRQTAMSGQTLQFSEADLAASAAAYDPALHEAPIVIGHPAADAPAYGWVKSLSADASGLQAEPTQVDAAFAELVDAGRYKKISAAFYPPNAPTNPVPGVYYLRHVGFLGAQPPAVKGLKQVEFGESDDMVVFADWDDITNARLWRSLRDWFIGKFGLEEADKVIAAWDVSSLESAAAQPDASDENTQPTFADPATPTQQEPTVTQEEADALRAENEALKRQFAASKKAAQAAEFGEFLGGLVKDGRVLPAEMPGLLAFMQALPDDVLEFGEGDERVSQPQTTFIRSFLSNLPRRVEFGEVAGGRAAEVDNSPQQIAAKAAALQTRLKSEGSDISFAEAVQRISQQS